MDTRLPAPAFSEASGQIILTPDRRVRVFISSTLEELAEERRAVRAAVEVLHLTAVLFEFGARPHPPRDLYRAYLEASDVFIGIYGDRYGWVAPDMDVSGLEDEYDLAAAKPRLLYLRRSEQREQRMVGLIQRMEGDASASFVYFDDVDDLRHRVEDDLALLLSESFAQRTIRSPSAAGGMSLTPSVPGVVDELVGRAQELRELRRLVERERLVTVTGPGGVGKTRLVLEMLRELDTSGVDGPWFVDLAGIDDPDLVPWAVAQGMGLVVSTGQQVDAVIVAAVGERDLLLVLDNCEHVVEAAARLVADLLRSCANVRVLATSREPLQVRGEVLQGLEPLPVQVDGAEGSVLDGAAMRLFETRGAQVSPGFVVDDTNRAVVRRLVEELDGLPLAIELSAAHLRVLSPSQMADHLDERFCLLAGGPRDAPDRHRTLRATIDWSYRLLTPEEQELFRALSVFRGGFELDAAERVTGLGTFDLFSQLEGLVAKSLVVTDSRWDIGRYRLLVSLRVYGEEQSGPDERAHLRRRHLAWFADLTDHLDEALRGPQAREAFARLVREADNTHAALSHALETGSGDHALRIAGNLSWFWYRRGDVVVARRWLRQALDDAPEADGELRGRALLGLGGIEYLGGDLSQAALDCDTARRLADEAGDLRTLARARMYAAYFRAGLGELEVAQRLALAGRELAASAGLTDVEAETYTALGQLARFAGRADEAEGLFLEGAAIANRIGHHWQEGSALWCAAKLALDSGDASLARDRLRRAIELNVADGDRTSTLAGIHTMAGALAELGRPQAGGRLLGAVDAIGGRIGYAPERMDPDDAQTTARRVERRLSPEEYEAALRDGSSLTMDEALGLIG
jgi:predicted ATPase